MREASLGRVPFLDRVCHKGGVEVRAADDAAVARIAVLVGRRSGGCFHLGSVVILWWMFFVVLFSCDNACRKGSHRGIAMKGPDFSRVHGVIGIITDDLSVYVRIKGRHRLFLPVLCSCAYSPPYTLTHNYTFSDFSYLTSLRKRANIRNSYHDL